jgi:hypothetical protein
VGRVVIATTPTPKDRGPRGVVRRKIAAGEAKNVVGWS